MARGKLRPASATLLLAWAFLLATICCFDTCQAQGRVSSLTPVYPSWDRVIEQLQQATADQKEQASSVAALASSGRSQGPGDTTDSDEYISSAELVPEAEYGYSDEPSSDGQAGRVSLMSVSPASAEDSAAEEAVQHTAGSTAADAYAETASGGVLDDDETYHEQQADAADNSAEEQPVQQQPQPRGQAVRVQLQSVVTEEDTSDSADTTAAAADDVGDAGTDQNKLPAQREPEQQPKHKGAFPARPSTFSNRPAADNRVSLQSLDAVLADGADIIVSPLSSSSGGEEVTASLQAFPPLPRLRGPRGAARDGQSAQQDPSQEEGTAASGSDAAQAGSSSADGASTKQRGPRVKLLPPSKLRWNPFPEQQPQQAAQHGPEPPLPAPTAEEDRKTDASDKQLAEAKIPPREPLHISPLPSLTTGCEVDPARALLQVPSSFMGLSHEWNHVADINAAPGYKAALRLLSSYNTGPLVVRIGGGSSDSTKDLLPQAVYKALRQLHKEAGVRFILGLNFEDVDLKLTQGQMQRARRSLPADALVTFELGNEPNFYSTKKNMTALEYSRCCFTTEWTEFARNLSCPCGTDQCCSEAQFAGPVWGHINVYPSTIRWFLDNAASYVSLVTVHWYKATKEAPNTPATLLDEGPLRAEADNLRQLVQVANSYGKPLRVAEMNTISNSGLLGVSNVFAAALWTLDTAFEVAAAGAVGVNLHQGAGQNLYTAILRKVDKDVLKPVVLRPPFYGILLFQQAVAGGVVLLDKQTLGPTPAPNIKAWPLLETSTGELRVVLINKHPKQAATHVLKLAGDSRSSYQSIARLSRLVAQGQDPLSATSGITLGGHYYSAGCVQQGRDQTLLLDADAGPGQQLAWSIYLPPGSATLVRIQAVNQVV